MAGKPDVILLHVVPLRRQKCAELPAQPKTYATSGALATRSTARRVQGPGGRLGSATGAKVVPAFVDAKRPSEKAARISVLPPFGWTLMSQQRCGLFTVQVVPLFVETKKPACVAA